MKIYFAHPVSDYNTSKEENDIEIIKSNFTNFEVLNPNSPENELAYKQLGMSHFESLVKTCAAIVCVPFSDGEWGMGVWKEADAMAKKGGKIYQLFNGQLNEVDYREVRPLSISETRRRISSSK